MFISNPACLYLYLSLGTYRQHSNRRILYVCAKRYIHIHTSYIHVCIRYIHVCITYIHACMCPICLNVYVCDSPRNSIVCIEPVWCLYFWKWYKLIHTCLYLHVWCLYLVSIMSEFCIYLESILSIIQAHTYFYACACILIASWLYLIWIFEPNSCK